MHRIMRGGITAAAAGIVALALASPAHATEPAPVPEAVTGDDGCTVTISAAGEMHVTSETVTAGLAVRVGGATTVDRGGLVEDGGTSQAFSASVEVGPFDEPTVVQWLLFGGPERDDDSPTQPDPVAVDAHVNGDGPADGIEWYELELPACPADPEPTPTATAEPTMEPSEPAAPGEGGSDEELAQTGIPTGGLAMIGVAVVLLGGALVLLARRTRPDMS